MQALEPWQRLGSLSADAQSAEGGRYQCTVRGNAASGRLGEQQVAAGVQNAEVRGSGKDFTESAI